MIGWGATGRADHPWSAGGAGLGRPFAAGRTKVGSRLIVPSAAFRAQVGTAPCCPRGTGAREDAMVITSLPSIQLGQHAVLTLPKKVLAVSGWRLAACKKNEQREIGDRMIGWGHIFRSRVSAIGTQVQVIGFGAREICPLSSVIDSAISTSGGRWQLQVAGGGNNPLSPQRSPPFSPL